MVVAPGSKSLTNRELVLAALADGPSTLRAPLWSRDSELMVEGLRRSARASNGCRAPAGSATTCASRPADELVGSTTIDCGLAGTVMRFLPPVAALALGPTTFDGDETACAARWGRDPRRCGLGVDLDDDGRWALPFTVHGHGRVEGGELAIDASASSQFVSGLLLGAALRRGPRPRATGERLPSLPHIEMTDRRSRTAASRSSSPEAGHWIGRPGPIRGIDVDIEPDLSNAAPFLVAGAGRGRLGDDHRLAGADDAGRRELAEHPPAFGARVVRATATGSPCTREPPEPRHPGRRPRPLRGGRTVPNLVALAAFADGPRTLHGIGHIRHHETDRLAALVAELRGLGGRVDELDDGLRIEPRPLHGGAWRATPTTAWPPPARSSDSRSRASWSTTSAPTAKTLPQFTDALGADARMTWWEPTTTRTRPSSTSPTSGSGPTAKGNRPRTKRRPEHSDAVTGRVLGVDRGRYAVLVDEDGPDERTRSRRGARERAARKSVVTGDRVDLVGDTSGGEGTLARIVRHRASARRCCAAAPTTPTRSSGSSSPTPTRCSSSSPRPTPSRAPARRPLSRRGLGRRHPALLGRHQDRPRRPAEFLATSRDSTSRCSRARATRCPSSEIGAALVGPLHGVRRALGRRQVDARERARARREPRDRATSTSSRAAGAHVVLDGVAALPRPERAPAGSSTLPACARSASATSTPRTSSARSPTSPRSPRTARAAARTCRMPPTARSSRPSTRAGSARPGGTRLDSLQRLLATFAESLTRARLSPGDLTIRASRRFRLPRWTDDRRRLAPGDLAPDFTLDDQDGAP